MGRYARTDVDAGSAVSTGAATLAHLLVTAGPKSASRTALHEVLGVPLEIIAPSSGRCGCWTGTPGCPRRRR